MKKPFFNIYDGIFIEYLKNYNRHDVAVQQYHDSYELYLMINGRRKFFFNETCCTLTHGDLFLVKPFELHSSDSCDVEFYERYVMNFRANELSCILSNDELHLLFSGIQTILLHLNESQFDTVYTLFKTADTLSQNKKALSQKALCSCILTMLLFLKDIPKNSLTEFPDSISHEIITAINYINLNYSKNITLDDVSDIIHVSKYHFCRIFKASTGTSFIEYLHDVRIAHAQRMLTEGNTSISDIAVSCGFGSLSYFSRMFKKACGVSPKDFRIKN